MYLIRLGGEFLAALGAPRRQNPPAANGCHARAKAVPALAHEITGLECPFHCLLQKRPEFARPGVYVFGPAKSTTPGGAGSRNGDWNRGLGGPIYRSATGFGL